MHYKLLTPGPLTTTETVKQAMMVDHCTWDDDYKVITQRIRKELVAIANASEENYTAVLMQGSGSFGVESVLSSAVGENDKILIAANGAYGERMIQIAQANKLSYVSYMETYNKQPSAEKIAKMLEEDPAITHVSMIHCETTSGILNDIEEVTKVVKAKGRTMIVDAMSSFGGVEIPVEKYGIDFIISSSNKCIQGVPGFSFIIAKRDALAKCKGQARSLSLDLYSQWESMEKDGKWRFTSPTHVVLAFEQALKELKEEGGVQKRQERYVNNNRKLIQIMKKFGIKTYIDEAVQSPVITTFLCPKEEGFSFEDMYAFVKERGYALYPGKVTDADTFRIGNIGEIYQEDMEKLGQIMEEYLEGVRKNGKN